MLDELNPNITSSDETIRPDGAVELSQVFVYYENIIYQVQGYSI